MSLSRVLIVHSDPLVAGLMTSMLQTLGHRIEVAPNDRAAVRLLEHAPANLVLAGVNPDDPDALEFLSCMHRKVPQMPVILLFPDINLEKAREARLRGATSVLRYPLAANALRAAVAQALGEPEVDSPKPQSSYGGLREGPGLTNGKGNGNGPPYNRLNGHARLLFNDHNDAAPTRLSSPMPKSLANLNLPDDDLIGDDPTFRQAIELTRTIAATAALALIVGERGTGKSRVARMLHDQGPRPNGPFIEASCANLREAALDVELFGRRNGGYAEPNRQGKVDVARGGTLFLDDVSALTPNLQLKLLRLLRDGLTEPVGANAPELADVRVVMGSRGDIASLVPDGRFRQDLYYRIGVVTLKLPPLRFRGLDLDRLAEHFRERYANALGRDVREFAPASLEALHAHAWPGNVQELSEVIERAVLVCRGQRIEPNHLALVPRESSASIAGQLGAGASDNRSPTGEILPLKEAMEGPERQLILEALQSLDWNRQETARVLDINRTTLYKKMKKYGLLFDEPVWAS